ncbi:hypothetical protein B0H19DRAFT_1067835 [Mycena capillaripes]|nr:hypothetical protein B0H19DRAFT_1067835 [Mycena capillaripes]
MAPRLCQAELPVGVARCASPLERLSGFSLQLVPISSAVTPWPLAGRTQSMRQHRASWATPVSANYSIAHEAGGALTGPRGIMNPVYYIFFIVQLSMRERMNNVPVNERATQPVAAFYTIYDCRSAGITVNMHSIAWDLRMTTATMNTGTISFPAYLAAGPIALHVMRVSEGDGARIL